MFQACTGAVTADLLERQGLGDRAWDLVTLSIGGNDAQFADVLRRCIGALSGGEPAAALVGLHGVSLAVCRPLHADRDMDDGCGRRRPTQQGVKGTAAGTDRIAVRWSAARTGTW